MGLPDSITYNTRIRVNKTSGAGEAIDYEGKRFFYRLGKKIPSNTIVSLRWDGKINSVPLGSPEYLIVFVDDVKRVIWLLEHFTGDIRIRMRMYKKYCPHVVLEALQIRARRSAGYKRSRVNRKQDSF